VEEKVVWLYMIDNCDNAGFIEIDAGYMSFLIGLDESVILTAIKSLKKGVVNVGNRYFIKNFLRHQKNLPLNGKNNAHKQIIGILNDQMRYFPSICKHLLYGGEGEIDDSPLATEEEKQQTMREITKLLEED